MLAMKCRVCPKLVAVGARKRPKAFCSVECERAWRQQKYKGNTFRAGLKPSNAFAAGHVPWNKNKKGIHLSPSSEFAPGHTLTARDPLGTVKVRVDKQDKPRAWVKVADPNKWRMRAVVVWELAHGPLGKGLLVHHKDRNTLNDTIENLQAMTRAEHIAEHRRDLQKAKSV